MPSRPEKSVAVYQPEQADQYNQAIQILEERGEIDSDASEGEKLATLSRVVLRELQDQEATSDGQQSGIPWDTLSFILGILGTLLIVGLLLGGAVYAVTLVA